MSPFHAFLILLHILVTYDTSKERVFAGKVILHRGFSVFLHVIRVPFGDRLMYRELLILYHAE